MKRRYTSCDQTIWQLPMNTIWRIVFAHRLGCRAIWVSTLNGRAARGCRGMRLGPRHLNKL
jgi:hypothetical protein